MDFLRRWDHTVFLKINSFSDSKWDYLFGWPTFLGEAWVTLLLTLIFILIWDQRNNLLYRYSLVALSAAISGILARVLKNAFERRRPYHALFDLIQKGDIRINCIFKMDISHSFPSGHAATVFGLAVMLHYLYGRKVWFVYPLALWIALTRVYVGAHFPLDVIAGAGTGMVSSLLCIFIVEKWNLKPGGTPWLKKI